MSDLDKELEKELIGSTAGGKKLLNDQQIYVVAIISLFLWIPIGTIMAVFSLIRANEELDDYRANPTAYRQDSVAKVQNGRKIALVSIGLQLISIPAFIVFVILMS